MKPVNQPRVTKDESRDGRASARRGPKYREFVAAGGPHLVNDRGWTLKRAADEFGTSQANVSRWMAAWQEDVRRNVKQADWKVPQEAKDALEDFAQFRARYFRVPDESGELTAGVPYLTPGFQAEWIEFILRMLSSRPGGRGMILSPPRHGKSELLQHFCVWLICRNPNIALIWVGFNEDQAEETVGAVLDHLENTEALIRDFTGGKGFKPETRSGKQWSRGKFTVSTRTVTGIKAPTMSAMGRGSPLVSRDADAIILDDIVNDKTTQSPTQVAKDLHWLKTQVGTRKTPKTALLAIGSRQGDNDVWSHILDNPMWESKVYSAEDHTTGLCDGDTHDGCVLFPELRPYAYLQEQRADLGDYLYEMIFQNNPGESTGRVFKDEPLEEAKDHARDVGHVPRGTRLIAGLDPAEVGYQAAWLWAYDVESRMAYVVDVENVKGGGIPGARKVMGDWLDRYGCDLWIVENNGFQGALYLDGELMKWAREKGLVLRGHNTQSHNKWNKNLGVTGFAKWFDDGRVSIPWKTPAARAKMQQVLVALRNFNGERGRKQGSDIVMAGWFPTITMRLWGKKAKRQAVAQFNQTAYPFPTDMRHVPWRQTA